jgi:hypothetical protein
MLLKLYEQMLGEKHGKQTQRARRTHNQLKKDFDGDWLAMTIHMVRTGPTVGLKGLALKDRIEWSYEAEVLNVADLFAAEVVKKAAMNLIKVREWLSKKQAGK